MTANDSGGHRRFIYDGSSVVGEQDIASGNFVVVYDHGNGGLARQTRGTSASYYQFDGLGSTRQLTNASQAVTDTTSYDAWGNVLGSSGTTTNAFKYVGSLGYYADNDNGLMLLGARYYSSGVGRFWSVDPSRDGHNWYAYVTNNSVNKTDPSGLHANCWNPWTWVSNPECVGYWLWHGETWKEGFSHGWNSGYYSCLAKCYFAPVIGAGIVVGAAFVPDPSDMVVVTGLVPVIIYWWVKYGFHGMWTQVAQVTTVVGGWIETGARWVLVRAVPIWVIYTIVAAPSCAWYCSRYL